MEKRTEWAFPKQNQEKGPEDAGGNRRISNAIAELSFLRRDLTGEKSSQWEKKAAGRFSSANPRDCRKKIAAPRSIKKRAQYLST